MTPPPAHIHNGTAMILSNAVHALSGTESAESMAARAREVCCNATYGIETRSWPLVAQKLVLLTFRCFVSDIGSM